MSQFCATWVPLQTCRVMLAFSQNRQKIDCTSLPAGSVAELAVTACWLEITLVSASYITMCIWHKATSLAERNFSATTPFKSPLQQRRGRRVMPSCRRLVAGCHQGAPRQASCNQRHVIAGKGLQWRRGVLRIAREAALMAAAAACPLISPQA